MSWTYHGRIGSRLHLGCTLAEITPDKTKCPVNLGSSVFNMFPPSHVFTDGNTKVLAAVDYFNVCPCSW